MPFKVGQKVVPKYDKPWFTHHGPIYGPKHNEICEVTGVDFNKVAVISLKEYPPDQFCWWAADCFEPLVEDSVLEEQLNEIFEEVTI